MTARLVRTSALLLVGVACTVPARADWLGDFCQSVARDVKCRQCWPQPFVGPGRQSISEPMAIMVFNGWRRQNMLNDYHFEPATGQLTEAGRLKIRWIVTEAPEHHRTIYVHTAQSPDETAARLDAAQQLAARLVPQGELPAVLETNAPAYGWPAERVDAIGRKFQAAIPEPKLPAPQDPSTAN